MNIKSDRIDIVSIDSLVPHPKNMNDHPDDQIERLAKLIEYQGFRNPLVVQKGTNLIVAGHGRLMAAKKLGQKEVPVTYQEFESEAQLYAYMVSDNAIAEWAKLDLEKINDEALKIEDLELDTLGIQHFNLVDGVNAADESAEWSEIEDFEQGDEYINLSVQFKTELQREVFCKENYINVTSKGKKLGLQRCELSYLYNIQRKI